MKLGVILPTFRDDVAEALHVARVAAASGLDGVFAYDHLWPMAQRERPALAPFPVLARVAARHPSLVVAPLVARVGLVSEAHLVAQFETLAAVAPGRVIAALGTGDRLSAEENLAYGLPFESADRRRGSLASVARSLATTMPVWIGGGSAATHALARDLGATVNLWDRSSEQVASEAASGPVNWAGPPPSSLHAWLDALATAGATWAIFTPSVDTAELAKWRSGSATHYIS